MGHAVVQQRSIAFTHGRRQGNHRGTIIKPGTVADVILAQGKEVATPQLQAVVPIHLECPTLADFRLQLLLGKKILDGALGQLDTEHLVPLPRQPGQVQAFATQRHQHLAARRQAQRGPVPLQVGVDLPLMKPDLIVCPALVPELRLHGIPRIFRSNNAKTYIRFRSMT
ncbi:hypothetical protein D3C80_1615380 [compost metagenome]